MQLVKKMASYIDAASESSSSSASESETEIGLFDENEKKMKHAEARHCMEKQPSEMFLKFRKFHRKTPVC